MSRLYYVTIGDGYGPSPITSVRAADIRSAVRHVLKRTHVPDACVVCAYRADSGPIYDLSDYARHWLAHWRSVL